MWSKPDAIDSVDLALDVAKRTLEYYEDFFKVSYPLPKLGRYDFLCSLCLRIMLPLYRKPFGDKHGRWLSAIDKHPIRMEYCVNCIDYSICSNQKHSTYRNNPGRNISAETAALCRRWSVVLFVTCFRLTRKPSLRFDFAVTSLNKITDYNL